MNDRAQDDAALLAAWSGGDQAAGDRLLQSAFPRLHRFLFNKVGDDTRDLVQQTLLACVEHRHKLEQCVSFEAYLLRIARNKLYDFLRKRARSREDFAGELPSVEELTTSMASLLARKERDRQILSALRRLPVDLQVVVELHYWNELTIREMADVLELAEGTVKTRLRRARREFEEVLADPTFSADAVSTVRP